MESAAVMPLSSAHETVTDKMRAPFFSRRHALPSRVPQPSDACAARTARMCAENFGTNRSAMLSSSDTPGSALPNTNIPGLIGGFAGERVLRAPCDGIFTAVHRIGDTVEEGETIGFVEGQPMKCTISGVLRGVLDDGVPVKKGMKSGDVDPRCKPEYCTTISDKALAVGGGVVEAVLYLNAKQQGRR